SPAALAGLVAAIATVAKYVQAGLAKWTALGKAAEGGSAAAKPGLLTKLAGRLRQVLLVVIALVVTLLTRAAANVNRLSMHDFYRWRLASAFAITRQAAEATAP